MRKIALIALLVAVALGMSCGISFAAENWSKYESGRNNIRLDGYHGQPGYIAFYDGDGNLAGYLFASRDPNTGLVQLIFVSPDAFSTGGLGTQSLEDVSYGNVIDMGTTQVH